MTCRVVFAVMLAAFVWTGGSFAAPGAPFGGDDAGCVPLNKNAAKCQDAVAKAASKALVCIDNCHLKRADGKLVDDTAEDACESGGPKSCKGKYDAATGPASKINALCPPCLTAAARANVFTAIESQLDNATNAAVFCAPGTGPLGGDDQGNATAAKSNDRKCEDAVAKALSKASACVIGCNIKLADGKLADDTAEDACEKGGPKSCKGKYDAATGPSSKINPVCPGCLDATARGGLFGAAETQADSTLGSMVYCCEVTTTTTTTTTTTSTTTTTTCPPSTHQILKGSLTATAGRFNYNLQVGLPAANSACSTNFPGTHACTYQDLQNAAAACDLIGLQDTSAMTVTSFWAIDSNQPILSQCNDDGVGGSNLNWEYQTAHTLSRGNWVALTNATGQLGTLQMGQQCNFTQKWVGCCQ